MAEPNKAARDNGPAVEALAKDIYVQLIARGALGRDLEHHADMARKAAMAFYTNPKPAEMPRP